MSDRDTIFQRIRESLEKLPERAPYPEYDTALAVMRQPKEFANLAEQFIWRLESVHGIALRGWEAISDFLQQQKLKAGYCDPEYMETLSSLCPSITFHEIFRQEEPDLYEFGITPAAAVIAETGTIILKDTTGPRLAALAPWVHIAVVDPANILPDVPAAIAAFGDDPNVVFVTGPSKTADVEGILIEGVHGPGVQACCLLTTQ